MRITSIVLGIMALLSTFSAQAAGPTDLKAFYRSGQTFLTWQEDASAQGEWYWIYRASAPITDATLKSAELIAKVPEGSQRYRFLAGIDEKLKTLIDGGYRDAFSGIQLEDDDNASKQLPAGTGVFVNTIKKAGTFFYAVLPADATRGILAGKNSVDKGIVENVETPGAIRLKKLDDNYFLFLFFADFALWNPDKVDDNWEGYAHIMQVRGPAGATGEKKLPAILLLHAYTAYKDWELKTYPPKDHVKVTLLDYHNGWWFGYSDARSTSNWPSKVAPKGIVRNFSELRIVQVVNWLASEPKNFPLRVDPNRISLTGMSMGATGANIAGMRLGSLFSNIASSKGITNWTLPADQNIWYESVIKQVGPVIKGQSYATADGKTVFDSLDMPRFLASRQDLETPFIDLGFGTIDNVIPFASVVDYLKALEKGKHPYAVSWRMEGHSSHLNSGTPMKPKLFLRNESVPAFSNASCNSSMRSGFRIIDTALEVKEKTLTIKPGSLDGDNNFHKEGSFPTNLAGKLLIVGAGPTTRKSFKIASNTATTLTIASGNLLADPPPLSEYHQGELKKELGHEPSPAELKTAAKKNLNKFVILDGDPVGTWNGYFAWSSRLQNFDPKSSEDDPIDEDKRWVMFIRLEENEIVGSPTDKSATVDVTPRRCQKFKPAPGEKVRWELTDYSTISAPRQIGGGEVVADKNGLVTIAKVAVHKGGWGTRLELSRK